MHIKIHQTSESNWLYCMCRLSGKHTSPRTYIDDQICILIVFCTNVYMSKYKTSIEWNDTAIKSVACAFQKTWLQFFQPNQQTSQTRFCVRKPLLGSVTAAAADQESRTNQCAPPCPMRSRLLAQIFGKVTQSVPIWDELVKYLQ